MALPKSRWPLPAVPLLIAGMIVYGSGTPVSGGNVLVGSVLVFGAVCCEAAYTLIGKRLRSDMEAVDVAALATLIAIPMFAVFAAIEAAGFDWARVTAAAWIALLWWSLGTLALGTLIWYLGVRKLPASISAGFMGVMPLSAMALSFVLLGEPFEPVDLLGAVAVVAAIVVIAYGNEGKAHRQPAARSKNAERVRAG